MNIQANDFDDNETYFYMDGLCLNLTNVLSPISAKWSQGYKECRLSCQAVVMQHINIKNVYSWSNTINVNEKLNDKLLWLASLNNWICVNHLYQ